MVKPLELVCLSLNPEGLLIVFVGVAMFWAGWVGSQARGLSCLGATLVQYVGYIYYARHMES